MLAALLAMLIAVAVIAGWIYLAPIKYFFTGGPEYAPRYFFTS